MSDDQPPAPAASNHVDVVIVGAGISGISAAYHLQRDCPDKTYAVLEARPRAGGTWDQFRYPGIRSDADMFTYGFGFNPWLSTTAIAEGADILAYIRDTARRFGIDRQIRFNHRVAGAQWSSQTGRWTLDVERDGEPVTISCAFLLVCGGYFDYAAGYLPDYPQRSRFGGVLVDPQYWPADLDHAGKRVVIIGSGSTAVSLLPVLARTAASVTMLQRSPSYVLSMPAVDHLAKLLSKILPARAMWSIVRAKNIFRMTVAYHMCKGVPRFMRAVFRGAMKHALPKGYPVDTHFNPRYLPWDQAISIVPDNDFFEALHGDTARVVTDELVQFTETGLELKSGTGLPADIVVSATGFRLKFLGGIELVVDGEEIDPGQRVCYQDMMLEGVPNLVFSLGYSNLSWTLKSDLTAEYACRLINHLDARGQHRVAPARADAALARTPYLEQNSTYALRGIDEFPKRGTESPWRLRAVLPVDALNLRYRRIDDGVLQFGTTAPAIETPSAAH